MNMRLLAPGLIFVAGVLLSVKISPAKPDYTRRTGKECEFCHPPNSRKLTPAASITATTRIRSKVTSRPSRNRAPRRLNPNRASRAGTARADKIMGEVIGRAWELACQRRERAVERSAWVRLVVGIVCM